MKQTLSLFILLICFVSMHAQSVSGNVNSNKTKETIGFANVNIYKNGKLVANVLTDVNGNYKVKLDTGHYQCEILYAGYKPIKQEIVVKGDERADLGMDIDSTRTDVVIINRKAEDRMVMREMDHADIRELDDVEFRTLSAPSGVVYIEADGYASGYASDSVSASGGTTAYSYSWSSQSSYRSSCWITYNWGAPVKMDSILHGRLTATEINDFSKWELWKDLSETELSTYRNQWSLTPNDRYVVQVTGMDKLPLAGAKVQLIIGGRTVYNAVSDNTGKAELWGSIGKDLLPENTIASISVIYKGNTKKISAAKKFANGINFAQFDVSCDQSQNVDIAFVIDATGSMGDEISYLQQDLNDVVYRSKEFSTQLTLRFADVFYRDTMDQYLTQSMDFTNVLSESVSFINNHGASGGGDTPEAVEVALDSAINHLHWKEDTRAKIIFLVLDAPPHDNAARQKKMKELCLLAASKGIRIVPVIGSGSEKNNEYLMRCIALLTNGTNVFLTNHSGIGGTHTAPSTDHMQVELLNDVLTHIIKSFTYMPDCSKNVADLGITLPDSAVTIQYSLLPVPKDSLAAASLPKDSTDLKWSFYPNPTSGIVNIVSNKKIDELFITDLSGKLIVHLKNLEPGITATADLSGMATGIYLVRYPVGNGWMSGQIVLAN